ncbi:SEL1-like repeat protein [Falsiroseomonas oryzae]|uniref:hypothetical protein n=1 Tax=Falsiroseomonas oryzae TaxID=2766473 RepID=UPI0022EAF690|nr:hypothetical protein [Roseomonas sp. MO-31]
MSKYVPKPATAVQDTSWRHPLEGAAPLARSSVERLRNGWRLVTNARIGMAPPGRTPGDEIMLHIVLIGPAFGVALLDVEPAWHPDALPRFRAMLRDRGFEAAFPGYLPVIYRRLSRSSMHEVEAILSEAVVWQERMSMPPGGAWADALQDLLVGGRRLLPPVAAPPASAPRPVDRPDPARPRRWLAPLAAAGAAATLLFLVMTRDDGAAPARQSDAAPILLEQARGSASNLALPRQEAKVQGQADETPLALALADARDALRGVRHLGPETPPREPQPAQFAVPNAVAQAAGSFDALRDSRGAPADAAWEAAPTPQTEVAPSAGADVETATAESAPPVPAESAAVPLLLPLPDLKLVKPGPAATVEPVVPRQAAPTHPSPAASEQLEEPAEPASAAEGEPSRPPASADLAPVPAPVVAPAEVALPYPAPVLTAPPAPSVVPPSNIAMPRSTPLPLPAAESFPDPEPMPLPSAEAPATTIAPPSDVEIAAGSPVQTALPAELVPARVPPAAVAAPSSAPVPEALPPAQPAQDARPAGLGLPAAVVAALIRRGDAMLAMGDISAARLLYGRAANEGSGAAALALGRTHDPAVLNALGARGLRADPAVAADWYRRALALGEAGAEPLLRSVQGGR